MSVTEPMMWVQLAFVTPAGVSISVIFLPAPRGFFKPDRGGGGGGVPFAPEGGGGGGGGLFIPAQSADLMPLMHASPAAYNNAMHTCVLNLSISMYSNATSVNSHTPHACGQSAHVELCRCS